MLTTVDNRARTTDITFNMLTLGECFQTADAHMLMMKISNHNVLIYDEELCEWGESCLYFNDDDDVIPFTTTIIVEEN